MGAGVSKERAQGLSQDRQEQPPKQNPVALVCVGGLVMGRDPDFSGDRAPSGGPGWQRQLREDGAGGSGGCRGAADPGGGRGTEALAQTRVVRGGGQAATAGRGGCFEKGATDPWFQMSERPRLTLARLLATRGVNQPVYISPDIRYFPN